MDMVPALRALASERRVRILDRLCEPRKHFRGQVDGDLIEDGVCGRDLEKV
jgi:ArsR family transcriptional regulator